MNLCAFEKRPPRRALARGALAVLLTLYVFNIYPKVSFGIDVEVENIFDFSVPVGVVETGVVQAAVGNTDLAYWENVVDSLPDDIHEWTEGLADGDGWVSVAPYAQGYNTNNRIHTFSTSIGGRPAPVMGFNSFGSIYTEGALSTATNSSVTNFLFLDSSLPWLSVPQLDSVFSLLSEYSENPPETTPLAQADDVLGQVGPAASFFVTELTPEVLSTFDGGVLETLIESIPNDGIFAYVPQAWPEIKTKIALIFESHKLALRSFIGPACCLAYVFLCFRWWLRRIFFVFEVFAGVGSGRDEPWSTDAEMKE